MSSPFDAPPPDPDSDPHPELSTGQPFSGREAPPPSNRARAEVPQDLRPRTSATAQDIGYRSRPVMPLPIIVVTALSILFVMAGAPLTDYLYGWALLSDIQVLGAACGIAFFIYPGARTRIAMTVSAVLTMITLVGIPLGGAILYFFWISSAGQQYFVDWSKQGR